MCGFRCVDETWVGGISFLVKLPIFTQEFLNKMCSLTFLKFKKNIGIFFSNLPAFIATNFLKKVIKFFYSSGWKEMFSHWICSVDCVSFLNLQNVVFGNGVCFLYHVGSDFPDCFDKSVFRIFFFFFFLFFSWVLRMKEYEREKRLKMRAARIQTKKEEEISEWWHFL